MEIEERRAKIRGAFEQMNRRLNDLKWEARIWFIILLVVLTAYQFIS